ncbi:hypothetical protein [Dysgonomonas gadei]|uniref:Uncharacterized protein n=1 Tax=Dysgonomonas gadei ATCC BAA-286 TaxID=742766 RepID=F5IYI0_9BACT|nr:hypothetical protein [Dysgonomonas gadei]EGK01615.1 hypothetical protein HMPREF9455_02147 [Dysgonomonas gadei ATCC BAA-286]
MTKNIQKYLLLHYPNIWNIRIVPMLFIMVVVHLIFFGIGYLSTDISFGKTHYYSPASDLGILYPTSILISLLILIGWLVLFNRNNGFKIFYPKKTGQLYGEWLMIFLITTCISCIPLTLTQGYIFKWNSVSSYDEATKAMELLDKVRVLIPDETESFSYSSDYDSPIPIPHNIMLDPDTLDLSLYAVDYNRNDGIRIEGYTGPSLLFYKDYKFNNYYYYHKDIQNIEVSERQKINRQKQVKEWLINGQKDSIYTIMLAFEKLQKKHGLPIKLTPDKWMERIYNPPFFPVNRSTLIANYQLGEDEVYYTDEYPVAAADSDSDVIAGYPEYYHTQTTPSLPSEDLSAGYSHILDYYDYNYNNELQTIVFICLYMSLAASSFIFSFRVTGRKEWLTMLISMGILIFISVLLAAGFYEITRWADSEVISIFMISLWLILFLILVTKIIFKIVTKGKKGRSGIYINLLIWMIPCLIPLIYAILIAFEELTRNYEDRYYGEDEQFMTMLWINIPFIILAMCLVSVLVRRWKSIAEE